MQFHLFSQCILCIQYSVKSPCSTDVAKLSRNQNSIEHGSATKDTTGLHNFQSLILFSKHVPHIIVHKKMWKSCPKSKKSNFTAITDINISVCVCVLCIFIVFPPRNGTHCFQSSFCMKLIYSARVCIDL